MRIKIWHLPPADSLKLNVFECTEGRDQRLVMSGTEQRKMIGEAKNIR